MDRCSARLGGKLFALLYYDYIEKVRTHRKRCLVINGKKKHFRRDNKLMFVGTYVLQE